LSIQKPVGLLCTSGTAVLNYGPAIAEAFYQNVPLFVITADRPPELIDQNEGQSIRQNFLFQAHTKFSSVLPSLDPSAEAGLHTKRILNQAWLEADQFPKGPVHINVPLREPLYPEGEINFTGPENNFKVVSSRKELDRYVLSSLIETWNKTEKRLVIVGQMNPNWALRNALKALSEYGQVPVLGDCLHNLKEFQGLISNADSFPKAFWENKEIGPDLIITIGNGILSKSIKQFSKNLKPETHWHIQESGFPADPYSSITSLIHADPEWVITKLGEGAFFSNYKPDSVASIFNKRWMFADEQADKDVKQFYTACEWSDFKAVGMLMQNLPEKAVLFLGNSMPIRYANWFAGELKNGHQIFANRGTSGIDGCVSTSVGLAIGNPDLPVICLVGDMSFFYDRNGIWNDKIPSNLKFFVLNNGGGNIFRIIPGSSQVPELESLFEMHQHLSARKTAEDAGLDYWISEDFAQLENQFSSFMKSKNASLMECKTDKYQNATVVKSIKKWINQEK
jgi:2-succinyl-5-enolpyruvyl-6-hydroxy-3-cyclohexene-1-carboxylate synthase